MSNNSYRIEGIPGEQDDSNTKQDHSEGMHTNNGVPRDQANVEAEKGETMVTSDGVSNQKKIVAIGGKKHSEGGTPLDVSEGTIIYSDKLKIKDPMILKFFNESGKKEKTFAQISKKYDITKWQEELKDENNDKITDDSLSKNLDDGNFKLSALFAVQEFHEEKGSPDEHSKHFEPFMERMGINYDQLFGTEGQSTEDNQPLLARNGMEVGFDELPEMPHGGTHAPPGHGRTDPYGPNQAYKERGAVQLNKILEGLGLEPIAEKDYNNRRTIKAKVFEAQKKAAEMPNIVSDFMFNFEGEDKSHRPNNLMQDALWKKSEQDSDFPKPKAGKAKGYTNQELQDLKASGKIDDAFVVKNFQDGLWHYRMPWSHITDVDDKTKFAALQDKLKDGVTGSDGNIYLYKGVGEYEAYRYNPDGSIERVEPNPKVIDGSYEWDNKKSIDARPRERNMDYRWDHKRATAQAIKNKRNIPRISPFSAIEESSSVDQAYYNPDQNIAAIQALTDNAGTKAAMFAPQQQQTANFLAGQQFEMMSKVIGQYEDKNVAAYNRENQINTQIANRSSQRLASAIEGHHDKTTILQQEYANARTIADNNITENEIAMWNERRNRLNLEATIGEQYATDPNTGIHNFQYGKDYGPNGARAQDIADIYSDIQSRVPPGTSSADITRMAMAVMKGDYTMDQGVVPNAANYS